MYDIPELPDKGPGGHSCESLAPVYEVSMGMGGNIDGLLVCDSCRGIVTVDLLSYQWVHAPKFKI
jgi:hypothetical protein